MTKGKELLRVVKRKNI